MKPCKRLCQAGLLLALGGFLITGCDSDSDSGSDAQPEEHALVGVWEVNEFAGLALPIDMTIDTGYSTYRTEQNGLLTLYPDTQGFVDLVARETYEGENAYESVAVYSVRLSETEDGYKLRLTRYDAAVFLACTLDGSTLTCIDNDAEEPNPNDPEARDTRNYRFERTSSEI